MDNRIFCTFSTEDTVGKVVDTIRSNYTVLYHKVFVLFAEEQAEYLITYNLDIPNISKFPENTILVHRRKASNTLYTINALNLLIKQSNGGALDKGYQIDWDFYRNCLLLVRNCEFLKMNTRLKNIINT